MGIYMPYLHGKQEELLAVLELSSSLSALVVPIVKPINSNLSTTVGRLARIAEHTRVAVITNSDKGRNNRPPTFDEVCAMIEGEALSSREANVLPTLEIRADTTVDRLDMFSRRFAERRCVLVHKRHTLDAPQLQSAMHFSDDPVHVYVEPGVSASQLSGLRSAASVVLRDGFSACERNADYPDRSAFDDIAHSYSTRGFDGFGDCSMIGDRYSDTGGPAKAVALHLTEDDGETLSMNHFTSSSRGVNAQTMYFEALEGLVRYVRAHPELGTQGVQRYLQSHATRHYPNLGPAKRWSTMHHIEIVERLLQQEGTVATF